MEHTPGNQQRVLNHAWSVDEAHVYFRGNALKNADVATFTVINDMFARDSSRVFCATGPTKAVVDASTFEALDSGCSVGGDGSRRYLGYARDATRVYFADRGGSLRAIAGADPKSFHSAGHGFGYDARHVYCVGWRIKGVKPAGFELLNEHYARTADAVIFGGGKIEGAIPAEFRVIDEYRGRDSKRSYAGGRAEEKPAFSIGGYEFRFRRDSNRSGALWTLVFTVMVFAGMLVWLYEKLTWWRHRDEETPAVEDPERLAKLRQLAAALANGDKKALKPVLLAIDDMPAFIEKYSTRKPFADEPDYAALLENADEDPSPYWVLHEVFTNRGLLGVIDWRSGTDETMSLVDPMLHRLGVNTFDWSFIDVLAEQGDGTELRNNNFLTLLRDRLGVHGLTLAHLDQFGDSYGFAVLRKEDFAAIDGLKVEGEFAVRADFGADDSYQRGTSILERILPARA